MDGKKIKETIEAFQDQIEWIKAITDAESEELCEGCIEYFETAIEALEKQLPKKPDADNDWIPVDEELPPFGERLQATILHHEWITDYDSSWVPEKEKTYCQEYTEVCEIYPKDGMWFYTCKEDDYEGEVAYIKPAKDLGSPISEIIAWKPLPEPYKQN